VSESQGFRHEALFYEGGEGFLAGVVPFVRDSVAAGEPILMALDQEKIGAIRHGLGIDAGDGLVHFTEMRQLGRNPACIIPAWRDFVAEHGGRGRPIRGIGEPIWAGRSDAELVECHQHESLLNLAFDDAPDFWLVCPYDVAALDPQAVDEARRTHPVVAERGARRASDAYAPANGTLEAPLPEPVGEPHELPFGRRELADVRRFVSSGARHAGLEPERAADLMLAASELATNSVLHGGGGGTVRVWAEGEEVLCEVRDAGSIDEPLVGRNRPVGDRSSGRGLWLVNHVCDLVQLRSFTTGNVARLHMRLGASGQ
jgi:anti-sigma regulatory factor (Ser/Thr protein kinase)